MADALSLTLFIAAGLGLALIALQVLALRRHLARTPREPSATPGISILKPLCGVDDRLQENLERFAELEYPEYEVVLGVRDARDPAFRVARAAVRRWPHLFRLVIQRGEPGLNPKVNQLITLASMSRHDVLVISDSNVQVGRGYLREISALLEDPQVGLVTHPIAGVGARRAGSVMDHLHLTASITPGVVAAKALGGRDIVVGKSMALRRRDLEAMGGFEAVKDVLAEDYVMGVSVGAALRKRVAVARRPIFDVSERRSVAAFAARYRRWGVMQRQAAGPLAYCCLALLNPVLLAVSAAAIQRSPGALGAMCATCVGKAALDGIAARALRPGGFPLHQLALVPVKDLLIGMSWAYGLVRREVDWRGTRLRVLRGTRLEPVSVESPLEALRKAAGA